MSERDGPAAPVPGAPEKPAISLLFAWTDTAAAKRWGLWALAAVCVALFVIELVLPARLHADTAKVPAKYGMIAFASVSFVMLAGWAVGGLRRKPDYYGEPERRGFADDAAGDDGVDHWRPEERGR